jgi:aminomethyltransferase
LTWVMGKDRAGYFGEKTIRDQLENGAPRSRVGIRLTEKGVAREGAEILTLMGEKVGDLTSGGWAPTLNAAIGQGYVKTSYSKDGSDILVRVRGRDIKGVITPLPFVSPKTKAAATKTA